MKVLIKHGHVYLTIEVSRNLNLYINNKDYNQNVISDKLHFISLCEGDNNRGHSKGEYNSILIIMHYNNI